MLNNKLCLTSVVKFLRRGRVDRGTGGGKVVVVVDLSKRKVTTPSQQGQQSHCDDNKDTSALMMTKIPLKQEG